MKPRHTAALGFGRMVSDAIPGHTGDMNSDFLLCDFCLRNAASDRSFVAGEGVARRCICYDCVLAFADAIKEAQPPKATAE